MKKLKQIAATLVSVILAGTVTVNASAAESMETPYRSPTLSSFRLMLLWKILRKPQITKI